MTLARTNMRFAACNERRAIVHVARGAGFVRNAVTDVTHDLRDLIQELLAAVLVKLRLRIPQGGQLLFGPRRPAGGLHDEGTIQERGLVGQKLLQSGGDPGNLGRGE